MTNGHWIEFDVPHNDEWWKRYSAPNFGRDDLPCRELYEEMAPFGVDPFFTDDEEVTYDPLSARVKAAKAACARCPVQDLCLEYALAAKVNDGIWGGTTPTERLNIRWKSRSSRGKKGN